MQPSPPIPFEEPVRNKVSYWRKAGGGSLTISIVVHAVILAIGLVWVLSVVPPPPEKKVDFSSSGGSGGTPASTVKTQQKRQERMNKSSVQRVAAAGISSNFTLPEPEQTSSLATLGSMGGGMGGMGSGGGSGDGRGVGLGSGVGDGMGNGPKMAVNPFGMMQADPKGLIGVLYDLKQTPARKPTDVTPQETPAIIHDFVSRGWKDSSFSGKYFKAPQRLSQTKVYIPLMKADAAPAAFQCEKDVEPSRWVIIYRGVVTPPRTGKYRFVGGGDDVLAVRFNNRNVLDHGWTSATTGQSISSNQALLSGTQDDKEKKKAFRDYPTKLPVTYYQYDSIEGWNKALGGLAVGQEFEARAGTSYPIEILICEIPGGSFGASLLIEETGRDYKKTSSGAPVLPLFRLDNTQLPSAGQAYAPPFDAEGPSWKSLPFQGKIDL